MGEDKKEEGLKVGDKVTVRAIRDIQGKPFIVGDILEVMEVDDVNAKLLSSRAGIYLLGVDFIDKVEEE